MLVNVTIGGYDIMSTGYLLGSPIFMPRFIVNVSKKEYSERYNFRNFVSKFVPATRAILCASVGIGLGMSSSLCKVDSKDFDSIKAAIYDVWLRANEKLYRLDASLPQRGTPLPSIPEPEVSIKGDVVRVVLSVPQELDVHSAVSYLRSKLRSPRLIHSNEKQNRRSRSGDNFSLDSISATTSEETSMGPDGRARRLKRQSSSEGNITVDILEPHDKNQPVKFEFEGESLLSHLEILSSTMEVAASPKGSYKFAKYPEWYRVPKSRSEDEFRRFGEGDFFDSVPGFENSPLDSFFGPFRDLLEELHNLHKDQQMHAWGWDSDDADKYAIGGTNRKQSTHFDSSETFHSEEKETSATPWNSPQSKAAIKKLESMGCQVFLPARTESLSEGPQEGHENASDINVDWGNLAGYEEQKKIIEDVLLLPLVRPDVYDNVARGTREQFTTNRPRSVLLIGPPGTGKTSSARVIANQAAVPLCYIPLEALSSKWYGETERHLADALSAADSLPEGCIVFLDELDALATSRAGEMHEATRRLLGVLLRHIDGFDSSKRSVVVGATNRPEDLDPALLSRFSTTIEFGLPGEKCRSEILRKYAHHLSSVELGSLAAATAGLSGRDLRDVCEQTEREWAARIVRGKEKESVLPPLDSYLRSAEQRLKSLAKTSSSLDNGTVEMKKKSLKLAM